MFLSGILQSLAFLFRQVGKVRVRTAQLGERSHATDTRLGYLEEQVAKIRSKIKQIRVSRRRDTVRKHGLEHPQGRHAINPEAAARRVQ